MAASSSSVVPLQFMPQIMSLEQRSQNVRQLMDGVRAYLEHAELDTEILLRLGKLSMDVQQITLINMIKQIGSILRKTQEQCDMLAMTSQVSTSVAKVMNILHSDDRQSLQRYVDSCRKSFEQNIGDLEVFTQLTRQLREQPSPQDWVQLYSSHRILREILFAFSVLGFSTTVPIRQRLFYPELAQDNAFTSPFSYRIGCNATLLKQFLMFLFKVKLEEGEDKDSTSNVRLVVSQEVGSEKTWRQELKALQIPTMKKRSRKSKGVSTVPKNRHTMTVSFDVRILDLLCELISLQSERSKPNWWPSSILGLTENRYLELYNQFLQQQEPIPEICECKARVVLEEHLNSVWKVLRNSRFFTKRLKHSIADEKVHHLQHGWVESPDPILIWKEEIGHQHQLLPNTIKLFQGKLVGAAKRSSCFWKDLRNAVESVDGKLTATELASKCQSPKVLALLEKEQTSSSSNKKRKSPPASV